MAAAIRPRVMAVFPYPTCGVTATMKSQYRMRYAATSHNMGTESTDLVSDDAASYNDGPRCSTFSTPVDAW